MKKKGNKKMPRLRQEIIDNPIPTSLFFNGVATHLQVFLRLRVSVPPTHVCAYGRPYKCTRNAVLNFHVNF